MINWNDSARYSSLSIFYYDSYVCDICVNMFIYGYILASMYALVHMEVIGQLSTSTAHHITF